MSVVEFVPGETPFGSDDLTSIHVIGRDTYWIVPTEKRKKQLVRKFPGLKYKVKTYEEAGV